MDTLWWTLAIVGLLAFWVVGEYFANRFQESWRRRAGDRFQRQQAWVIAIVVGVCIAFVLIGGFVFYRR